VLALSLTSGAVASAARHGVQRPQIVGHAAVARLPAAVTWHKLALKNGWKSSQALDATGNPSWAIQGRVVYLSGSLHSGLIDSDFAVLPPAARPAHALYITVYTLDGSQGWLYIRPTGKMFAVGSFVHGFTSLAGVSFPARSLPARRLALRNGWNSSQFRWNTGDPAYDVSGGVVYLSGSLHNRTSGGQVFTRLPKAARPAHNMYITVYTFQGSTGVLYLGADGIAKAFRGKARSFTSLAGVSFPARSLHGLSLSLVSGWSSSNGAFGTGDPAYAVHNGVVYLSGSLFQSGLPGEEFAVLPPGATPAHQLFIKIYTNDGVVGSMEVWPTGELDIFPAPAAALFSSLATVSFPLKS
jgi:hypothetical protein